MTAVTETDPMVEVQALLRTVDGSTLELGWLAGAGRWEASIADHPNQRVWTGEGDEPHEAVAVAIDRWSVGMCGAEIVECVDCSRPVYTYGQPGPRCVTCAPPVSGRGEETR